MLHIISYIQIGFSMKLRKAFPLALCFLIIISFFGCTSRKTIVNGLDEREANEILVFLANNNVDAIKVQAEGGGGAGAQKVVLWDISVESSQATQALALLNANGLPRRRGQNLLDVFSAGGLVPSDVQEKIRYQTGLGQQIASTIRKIDGVIDADVVLSFPEEDPLNPTAKKSPVTAAVYVKHTGVLDDPNSHLTSKIKQLVASAVPGLNYDNVTVVGDRARFNEGNLDIISKRTEEQNFVKVWSLIIAKDSLTRFQIMFFTFFILILIFFLMTCWLAWKIHPLLKKRGGYKKLFSMAQLPEEIQKTPEEKAQEDKAKSEEKKDESKEPKVQENIENP